MMKNVKRRFRTFMLKMTQKVECRKSKFVKIHLFFIYSSSASKFVKRRMRRAPPAAEVPRLLDLGDTGPGTWDPRGRSHGEHRSNKPAACLVYE